MAEPWLRCALTAPMGAGTLEAALACDAPAIGIIGPSGGGKSTLLRALAGLLPAARGPLQVFGADWHQPFRPPWQRQLGWVPQEAALFPHLDVRQNLTYAGAADLDAVVELLGLGALLTRAPRNLSGGERQRVALGRALLASPRLLLLDEPFAALDPARRRALAAALAARCARLGQKVVLVTHDAADLDPFAAPVFTMEEGRLKAGLSTA